MKCETPGPPSRMCIVCKKVKTYAEFAIRTRQSHVDTCKHCYYLKVSTVSIKL